MKSGKKYTNNQIKWLKKWTSKQFKAVSDAVDVVAIASKENNEKQNEWRGQLRDQADSFATREQVEHMNNQIIEIQKFQSNVLGKISIVGVIWSILLVIITWLLKSK